MYGQGIWGRMDTCTCMTESLCYSPGSVTTFLIGYPPVQNEKLLFFLIVYICQSPSSNWSHTPLDPWYANGFSLHLCVSFCFANKLAYTSFSRRHSYTFIYIFVFLFLSYFTLLTISWSTWCLTVDSVINTWDWDTQFGKIVLEEQQCNCELSSCLCVLTSWIYIYILCEDQK